MSNARNIQGGLFDGAFLCWKFAVSANFVGSSEECGFSWFMRRLSGKHEQGAEGLAAGYT